MARLQEHYRTNVVDALMQSLQLSNRMSVPALKKITLNMGVGEAAREKKAIEGALEELTLVSGQKAIMCRARKSVAAFKIREGMPIGCKVTLRGVRMYEFFDRLINIYIPRVRDFRGLSPKSFDGRGNYSFGIKEQVVFPEIDFDTVDKTRGLDVCITTTACSDVHAHALLQSFQFPFKEK